LRLKKGGAGEGKGRGGSSQAKVCLAIIMVWEGGEERGKNDSGRKISSDPIIGTYEKEWVPATGTTIK